ncbi:Herc2, partial [Symbiodinium sp. KB8]
SRGWLRVAPPEGGYPEVTWDLKTRDSLREVLLAFERVEPPFFEVTSRKDWDDEEGWNRDRWRSRNWWETAEEDQHWSWQQDTWQQDGQEWDQHQSWQYEAWGQDSQDPADPWQGWEGVAAWNERQAAKSDSTRRPRSPAQEPASGSRAREDPPRKKGRAWWERPPPEYHWKDGEWKKKNTRGTRSAQKQAERIERGQKRRLENPHREREAPPAPEAPAIPEEESSEESLDTGAPPVVLREAPAPLEPVDEEAAESTSESSSSSSEDEPEPLPAAASSAVSQQAERIRAVRLESSESEGKPSGPFSPSPPKDPRVPPARPRNKAAREEPPKKAAKPEPPHTRAQEAARAADGAFVVVKEEPDFSEDEATPQTSPPAEVSWVFVRDLLDEAAVDAEAPTSPAQAPEEAPAATAESSTGAGGPAQAGSTSPGVSEGSRDDATECTGSAADGGGRGPAAC